MISWNPFNKLPAGRRAVALAVTTTLFLTMAGHAVLETARDALFLSSIPASELPYVYIVIAFLSLAISRLVALGRKLLPPLRQLMTWISLKVAVTVGFGIWLNSGAPDWSLYVLYVWSGLAASVTLLLLFTILGGLSTIRDAKRSFAIAGSGSALGAIVGSGAAAVIANYAAAPVLIYVAAGLFSLALLGPFVLSRTSVERVDPLEPDLTDDTLRAIFRDMRDRPYVRALAALVALTTVTITLADYIFKAEVAAQVDVAGLASFFGVFYLVVNLASFLTQTLVVQFVLRRASVTGSLMVMPVLMFFGTLGFVLGGGLIAAAALRGIDGMLRHSLQRTATEVLYVPMRAAVRARVKAFIDIAGYRGAQAVTSLAILGALAMGSSSIELAWAALFASIGWLVVAASMRSRYLDVFRDRLRRSMDDVGLEFPELDVASLESLVVALNDPDDRKVIAALDLLVEEQKAHLIPALIVYHPSDEVVVRALHALGEPGRSDFLPHAMRIAADSSALVCASIVSAIAKAQPGQTEWLKEQFSDGRPGAAAVAAVFLFDQGAIDLEQSRTTIWRGLSEEPASKIAIAEAIEESANVRFEPLVLRMLNSSDRGLRSAAIEAARSLGSHQLIEALRDLLRDRDLRSRIRRAFTELGKPAEDVLVGSLRDTQLDSHVRWQIPRALSAFGPRAAAPMLELLETEQDGMLRYRIVRELEQLKLDFDLTLDAALLGKAIDETLGRAWWYQHARQIVSSEAEQSEQPVTVTQTLFLKMLDDKRDHAVNIVLRMLGLIHDSADFVSIREALDSDRPRVAASALELLEYIIDSRRRDALLGLVDPDSKKPPPFDFEAMSYEQLLGGFLYHDSRLLRLFAVRRVGELKLTEYRDTLEQLDEGEDEELTIVIERALAAFPDRAPLAEVAR